MTNTNVIIDSCDKLYNLSQRMGWSTQEMNKLAYDYFATHICLGINDDGNMYYGGYGIHEKNPFDDENLSSIENINELNSIAKKYHWTQDYLSRVTDDCFNNHYCGIQSNGSIHYWTNEIAIFDIIPFIG